MAERWIDQPSSYLTPSSSSNVQISLLAKLGNLTQSWLIGVICLLLAASWDNCGRWHQRPQSSYEKKKRKEEAQKFRHVMSYYPLIHRQHQVEGGTKIALFPLWLTLLVEPKCQSLKQKKDISKKERKNLWEKVQTFRRKGNFNKQLLNDFMHCSHRIRMARWGKKKWRRLSWGHTMNTMGERHLQWLKC